MSASGGAADSLFDLLCDEPEDELSSALQHAHRLLLKHPVAARAAFRALVAEGRTFAASPEGQVWAARLAGSELMRRGRSVWEVATLGMLDERSTELVPSQLLDALCHAVARPDLEPALARAVEPRVTSQALDEE